MTFLLFLASVAVLEYILHKDKPSQRRSSVDQENPSGVSWNSLPPDSSLASLAQALEEHGRGETVRLAEREEVTRTETKKDPE